jgi:hypothetical protein
MTQATAQCVVLQCVLVLALLLRLLPPLYTHHSFICFLLSRYVKNKNKIYTREKINRHEQSSQFLGIANINMYLCARSYLQIGEAESLFFLSRSRVDEVYTRHQHLKDIAQSAI